MKDFTGSLSRNRKKETEKHPDHKGSCIVAGTKYWISAYINESRDEGGGKYFKLYFRPADSAPAEPPAEPASIDLADQPDIPF